MSEKPTSNPSTSSAEGSRARISATLETVQGSPVIAPDSGGSSPESFARWDPDTCSWKTSQLCLLEGSETYSEPWPRSGTMQSGTAYRLPPLVPLTAVTGSLSSHSGPNSEGLWPTPVADGDRSTNYAQGGMSLGYAVRMWPTPRSCSAMAANFTPDAIKKAPERFPNLESVVAQTDPVPGGGLNPTWVEWLMGFPPDWTEV
jgi:hypothetical protein